MPTLRLMRDGRPSYATAGQQDATRIPSWAVGAGNTELVSLDFTAWLGTATLSASTWTVNGATSGTETNSGGVATVLVTVPTLPSFTACPVYTPLPAVTLGHTATASDGRVLRQLMRLYPQPSTVASAAVA